MDSGKSPVRRVGPGVHTRYLSEASSEMQASYRQAEAEAKGERRGLWSDLRQSSRGYLGALSGKQTKAKGVTSRSSDRVVILTLNQRKNAFIKAADLARDYHQFLVLACKLSLPNMCSQCVLAAGLTRVRATIGEAPQPHAQGNLFRSEELLRRSDYPFWETWASREPLAQADIANHLSCGSHFTNSFRPNREPIPLLRNRIAV